MQDDDRQEFQRNCDEYWRRVRGFLIRFGVQTADADNLAQDVIVKALQNWHQYQPGTNLIAWLLRIAYTKACNFANRQLQQQKTTISLTGSPDDDSQNSHAPSIGDAAPDLSPDRVAIAKEMFEMFRQALCQLNEKEREIVVLRLGNHGTLAEIADSRGQNRSNLASHYLRGRRRLVEILEHRLVPRGLSIDDMASVVSDWKFMGLTFG